MPALLIIGGLSGTGKSTLGRYFNSNFAYRWIELDDPEDPFKDVVDLLDIRNEWDAFFFRGDPAPLIGRYPGKTVITVSSCVIFPYEAVRSQHVRVCYLWGPEDKCFNRAHERRPQTDRTHWEHNNRAILSYLQSNECPPTSKIKVFNESGEPKNVDELALQASGTQQQHNM